MVWWLGLVERENQNRQQQEFRVKASAAAATTRNKRDVMAGMLESRPTLAMKKTVAWKLR
jgi:hypothetical protein